MLTEAGLESLILGSRKAVAKEFGAWVKAEFTKKTKESTDNSRLLSNFVFNGEYTIRIFIDENGDVWFIAIDVAKVLGYTDAQAMTRMIDESEKQNRQIVGFGNREVSIITEAGLYFAIIKSNKNEAVEFQKWISKEVLPSIRKHGYYALPQTQPDHSQLTTEISVMVEKLFEDKYHHFMTQHYFPAQQNLRTI